jgi:hypothetical protein
VLPKHPDLYTDDELDAWVKHLVDNQVAEGPRLDYKQTISLEGQRDRREAAKDISSFANEVGGCLVYGVPEKRLPKDRAIPQRPYGIDPIRELESRLENIYVDAVRPTLAEWRVRRIPLSEYPDKVVYLAWTPESWAGVHMVEAYGEHRYYRRGQFRAVEMTEREVRDRYERLLSARNWLDAFLKSPELNYVEDSIPSGFRSHYVICPMMPLIGRVIFSSRETREWLDANPYPPHTFQASPYGARTRLQFDGDSQELLPYMELYGNCAMSQWRSTEVAKPQTALAYVAELQHILEFLDYAGKFYTFVRYTGPVRVVIEIWHPVPPVMGGLTLPHPRHYQPWPRLLTHDNRLRLSVEDSAMTLIQEPKRILKAIGDEMFRAFGYWEAICFDENLNLVRR